MKLPVCHLPSHGPATTQVCTQKRGQNVSLPQDAGRPSGAAGPWDGTDNPIWRGHPERGGKRTRESHLSRKHPHSVPGLLQMLNSELLDMGLRRKTEERKLS